jgi:hypothetical protein
MKPAKVLVEVSKISAAKEAAIIDKYNGDILAKDDLQLIE